MMTPRLRRLRPVLSPTTLAFLIALWAGLVAPGAVPATVSVGSFTGSVVLGAPTATTVRVNLYSPDQDGDVYVRYGMTAGGSVGDRQTSTMALKAGVPLELALDGLTAATRHYYRLHFRPRGTTDFAMGPEASFHTARTTGSTFTFTVQGDSHPERTKTQFDAGLYQRTLDTAAADRPDFHFLLGDDFSVDTINEPLNAANVAARYALQRPYLGRIAPGAPLFLVNGNHEQAARYLLDGTPDNVAVWAQTARNAFYPQPAPDGFYTGNAEVVPHIGLLRNYFAWTWGDALFVVIDPYWSSPVPVDNVLANRSRRADPWAVTHGDAQYQWLKATLEGSKAKYKFVFAHHVMGTGRGGIELASLWEWGGRDRGGRDVFATQRPTWALPIHQLMAANKVTIFFQGHDHLFARQELDGVVYQTVPVPADPNYALLNADAYRSGDKLPNSGYLRVTVSPDAVDVDYVRTYRAADETTTRVSGATAFSYAVAGASTGVPFAGSLLLGAPATDRVRVNILSPDQGGIAALAYGPVGGTEADWRVTPAQVVAAASPTTLTLADLAADTRYAYRLHWRADGQDGWAKAGDYLFRTARPATASAAAAATVPAATAAATSASTGFTFTITADPHLDENSSLDQYQRTLLNVLADQPDFHVDLGDTFMCEKHCQPLTATLSPPKSQAEVDARYAYERANFGLFAHSVPLFLVNGNHDGEAGWQQNGSDQSLAVWTTRARQRYFLNPVPDAFYTGDTVAEPFVGQRASWFSWHWGDALFVVLDPYWNVPRRPNEGWTLSLGERQYRWLGETLAASHARFRFVFVHNLVGGLDGQMRGGVEAAPFYEWGGANADGSSGFAAQRPGWAEPIHDLLVRHGVTAVFHGHDHLYASQVKDGIVYQAVPQPSARNTDNGTSLAAAYHYTTGTIASSAGHLRVTVARDHVTAEYVRAWLAAKETTTRRNGQVDAAWTIAAP